MMVLRKRRALSAVLAVGAVWAMLAVAGGAQPGLAADDAAPRPPITAQAPLPVLDAAQTPAVDPRVLEPALVPLLADPALGPNPGAVVLDGVTGDRLLDQRADAAVIPASSLKVATGLAALAALGPGHQLRTTVVLDEAGIVLVGGGDPTLLTVPAPDPPAYVAPATLADLAAQTAAALQEAGRTSVQLTYDASLFSGPALLPDWDPTFVGLGIISPVSALTVDPASREIDPKSLDADPAAAAAAWFAARLGTLGITAALSGSGTAAASGQEIASVASPPMAALVGRLLDISDNDVGEALFRLAAVGLGLPGSFDGGAQAVTRVLDDLQVPVPGLRIRDGSGLSRENRIAPITLAAALQVAVEPDSAVLAGDRGQAGGPDLGGVTWAPPGLPVGGLTGSLAGRFDDGTAAGAGRVHAKTGTLTGVTSLTGVVATDQERPVVFAVLGNDTADTLQARSALDAVAARIAACGCSSGAS